MTLNTTGCGRWRQVNTPKDFCLPGFPGLRSVVKGYEFDQAVVLVQTLPYSFLNPGRWGKASFSLKSVFLQYQGRISLGAKGKGRCVVGRRIRGITEECAGSVVFTDPAHDLVSWSLCPLKAGRCMLPETSVATGCAADYALTHLRRSATASPIIAVPNRTRVPGSGTPDGGGGGPPIAQFGPQERRSTVSE